MKIRSFLTEGITFLLVALVSLMLIPKGAMLVTGVESPAMVVISGSMEPALKKGDMLFVHNMSNEPIREGEIVIFRVPGGEHPIVHRVIKVRENRDTGEIQILTKGDNNSVDDRFLYADGQLWLQPQEIIGRVAGHLPYVGWPNVFIIETFKRFGGEGGELSSRPWQSEGRGEDYLRATSGRGDQARPVLLAAARDLQTTSVRGGSIQQGKRKGGVE
ncbi:signal peptidase complex catalytic subunit SEC11A-like [Lolium rigidum]|uniref:signal peptidase complex catalytic subunit SEC11A-like n=1 Tax=Lolium rigidum TaxID=89674 RepID=UPI001F5C4367|nr:signal peptidase complex catalytic subunit SEC11A-like [Lolium rigidum]